MKKNKQFPYYLSWHYSGLGKETLIAWRNLLIFLYHYFSVPFLLKNLFSPWKRQIYTRKRPGFSLEEWFSVVTFNFFSRIIGFIVRCSFLFFWLLEEVFIFLTLPLFFILFLLPFWSMPFYWKEKIDASWPEIVFQRAKGEIKNTLLSLSYSPYGRFVFGRLLISYNELRGLPHNTQKIFASARKSEEKCLLTLAKRWPDFDDFLLKKKVSFEDLKNVSAWFYRREKQLKEERKIFSLDNLLKIPGIGKDWTYGYTPELDKYTQDLTKTSTAFPRLLGRKEEIAKIEEILLKAGENNVLLVGEPGVGRHPIITAFAYKISRGETLPGLKYKRVLELNLPAILGEKGQEESRAKLLELLKEAAYAGNTILVIDHFERYVSSQFTDLTEIFAQVIGRPDIQMIGLTTTSDYHRLIFPNLTINKFFEKVDVSEPDEAKTLIILQDSILPELEQKGILISYQALKETIEKASLFLIDVPFPEKAIDVLDEATTFSLLKLGQKIITPDEIDKFLSQKTKIPVGKLSTSEQKKLLELEKIIHKRLVNQEQAISQISKAMRRTRLDISARGKPIGTFLFLGPTGVGKTETAKALAEAYFGNEEQMIRFDMAEFQGQEGILKLAGSFEKREPGFLTKAVRDNPFAVLLLDEFEKSPKEIINLFLTVFDEGYLTDIQGKRVSFENLIIICTSNAAAYQIKTLVEQGKRGEDLHKEIIDYILAEKIFPPEILNRFDGVIVYEPLGTEELKKIAGLLLADLNERIHKNYGIALAITPALIEKVVKGGFSETFGARPMKRFIQDEIEAPLAEKILKGGIKRGEKITME